MHKKTFCINTIYSKCVVNELKHQTHPYSSLILYITLH